MTKKIINIAIVLVILIGISVWEDVLVTDSLRQVSDRVMEIQTVVSGKEDVNFAELLRLTESLEEFWLKRESPLCFLVNHKDVEDIGIELARAKSAIASNDMPTYKESLGLISFYTKSYLHMMGASFHNIL